MLHIFMLVLKMCGRYEINLGVMLSFLNYTHNHNSCMCHLVILLMPQSIFSKSN